MNEAITLTAVVSWASVLIVATMGWFLKRHFERFDELEKEAVRKRDLKELLESMEDKVDQKHATNIDAIQNLTESVNGTNKRIDEMFSKLLYRNGGR